MRLSVVVPTHNRPDVLLRTLDSLKRQTLDRGVFEVLVVDDGSNPANRERIRGLEFPYRYHRFEKPQGGLASARNIGAERAVGEILHFLDDDVLAHPDLLEQHLRSHDTAAKPVAVVGALPYPPHVEVDAFLWYLERSGHYDLYRHPDKYPGGRPPMPPLNGNSSIPRETFFAIGRYDETFRQYGSEDLDLGYRLDRAGVEFVYNPDAIGYHDHVKDFDAFRGDMETAGRSLVQLYRKHPDIREAKQIDLVEDRLRDLPRSKWVSKIVMDLSFAAPWLMAPALAVIRVTGGRYRWRHLLFPLYRWIAYYHYAVGMRQGLEADGPPGAAR